MKNTINAQLDPALWAKVTQTLKGSELARLMRALAALMNGEDPTEHLNTTGLRLAFALLSEPIAYSMERHERNRVNGAKGGRPRSNRTDETEEADADGDRGLPWVRTKKSKKEDLPPTPPIEEKIKKNNSIKNYQKNENTNNKNRWQFIADPVARREHERQSRLQEVCGVITQLATQGEQPAQVPF